MNLLQISNILKHYVVGSEGNISKRQENSFLIKSSGARLDMLTEDDLVLCDLNQIDISKHEKKPSMEYNFHALLYNMNSDINYIIHTHPINVMKIVCSPLIKKFSNVRFFPDQIVYNERKSCIVPYAHPGKKLSDQIERFIKIFIDENNFFPNTILLKNHGLITVGNTLKFTITSTQICEKSAEIFLNNIDLDLLSEVEINELLLDDNEMYRRNII